MYTMILDRSDTVVPFTVYRFGGQWTKTSLTQIRAIPFIRCALTIVRPQTLLQMCIDV